MARTPRDTFVRGVDFLPGGAFLTADAKGQVTQQCYWSLAPQAVQIHAAPDRSRNHPPAAAQAGAGTVIKRVRYGNPDSISA